MFYARRLRISPRLIKFPLLSLSLSLLNSGEDAGVAGSRFTSRQENVNRDTTFVTHPGERDVGKLFRAARLKLLRRDRRGGGGGTEEIARDGSDQKSDSVNSTWA